MKYERYSDDAAPLRCMAVLFLLVKHWGHYSLGALYFIERCWLRSILTIGALLFEDK